eukprot:3472836-Amphidinium_carterae.1
MLKSFRDRMRRLNDDMDKPSGRGARRRGPGGGGGVDGDDPNNPPSSSTSQAGDSYGPKRWLAYQKTKESKELELFKQRKALPKLTLGQNWRTMQPAL